MITLFGDYFEKFEEIDEDIPLAGIIRYKMAHDLMAS